MNDIVFLTGATGFVGRNLIPRILNLDPDTRLVLLIRGRSDDEAKSRFDNLLKSLLPMINAKVVKKRVMLVRGDITSKGLGITEPIYKKLTSEVTHIIHAAANVHFHQPLKQARQVNLGGTKNVIEFANYVHKSGKLKRIAYIGTAYVSGNRKGVIYENELDCSQEFANSYELSKFEAEIFIRQWVPKLPITIFRPSIIVGDSTTGITASFNVLYTPLKLIYRGLVKILPGSRKTAIDVVPIDFVCDAICHIIMRTDTSVGKIYHLTAGKETSTTTGEIVKLSLDYFNKMCNQKKLHKVRFIPLKLYNLAKHYLNIRSTRILQVFAEYEPYMSIERIFDNHNTLTALQGTSIIIPPFKQYYRFLLKYCIQTQWGKHLGNATR